MVSVDRVKRLKREKRPAAVYQYQKDGRYFGQIADSLKEAGGHIRELPQGLIAGSDVSAQAVGAARTNLMGLHYGNNVSVERADFRKLPALEGHVIVTNPPYGIRMGGDQNLEMFYKNLGDFLKQKCKGSAAFVYLGERQYIKKNRVESIMEKTDQGRRA
jgi:putative N6-adenine-specific DNA methylase